MARLLQFDTAGSTLSAAAGSGDRDDRVRNAASGKLHAALGGPDPIGR
jgi:hypothetical protein